MSIFKSNDKKSVVARMAETQLYEFVMDEIANEEKNKGIWGQAMVEADGDLNKAEAAYIKLRVQSLKDELILGQLLENERLAEIQKLYAENSKPKKGFFERMEEHSEKEKREVAAKRKKWKDDINSRIEENMRERGEID